MKIGKDQRIGIVGGGPAGLSFARELKAAGYHDVTVLEKELEVGGKCRTIEMEPGVTYELGASSLSNRYVKVGKLLDHYGIHMKKVETSRHFETVDPEYDATRSPWIRAFSDGSWSSIIRRAPESLRLLLNLLKFLPIYLYGQRVLEPGFGYVPERTLKETLSLSMYETLCRYGIDKLDLTFRNIVTGIGYGYLEEGAAAYLLKYLSVWIPEFTRFKVEPEEFELFETGFQGLFKRVAADLGEWVDTDCKVEAVLRPPDGQGPIKVHVSRKDPKDSDGNMKPVDFEFDHIVLACPLDHAATFLDGDAQENALLTKIESYTFHTLLAEVKGYPANRWGFFLENFVPDRKGQVVLSARRHLELDRVVFYVLDGPLPQGVSDEGGPCYFHLKDGDLKRELKGQSAHPRRQEYVRKIWDDLEKEIQRTMGIGGITSLQHVAWKYFPHFSLDDVKDGAPHKLESLQGKRRTYYLGEVMDFSIIERVIGYSEHVANCYFTGRKAVPNPGA